ncbi:MAG: hypothetical protein WBN40_09140, partial [Pseudomonadales bacterium]
MVKTPLQASAAAYSQFRESLLPIPFARRLLAVLHIDMYFHRKSIARALVLVFALVLIIPIVVAETPVAGTERDAEMTEDAVRSGSSVESELLQIPSRYLTSAPLEIEIAGFGISRRDFPATQLGIPDMEVVLAESGERWIPLVRLLYAFQLGVESDKNGFLFQPEFGDAVYIDLRQREIRYAGIAEPLDFIAGFSDITSSREVFLPPRTIAR